VGRRESSEEPKEPREADYRPTEKSSSKASKCSLEVFEKRVLNLSKLSNSVVDVENTLNVGRRED